MPKISIIAPVYCMEQYLEKFLQSIKQQTFQDYEVILVDDGSTDRSPSILDQYAEKESRAFVIHKENGGVSSARNVGLDNAKGEYIYIVDSDDWLETTALETLWGEVERTKADVVYGAFYSVNDSSAAVSRPFSHAFFTKDKDVINEIQAAINNTIRIKTKCKTLLPSICHGGAPWRGMFRRSIIEQFDIKYNERLRSIGEDILFWQNLFEHVNSVAYIDKPVYNYRIDNNSLSHGFKENFLETFQTAFEEEENFLRTHKKGKEHWDTYYIRVIEYIGRSINSYFMNQNNTKPEKERYKEFKCMLETYPFKDAVKKVPVKRFATNKKRIQVLLLRFKQTWIYWKYKSK